MAVRRRPRASPKTRPVEKRLRAPRGRGRGDAHLTPSPAAPKPAAWSAAGWPALVDLWLADLAAQNTRPRTLRTYRGALRRLAPALVETTTAAKLLTELGKLRPATRALYLSAARSFETWAVANGHRRRAQLADRVRVKLDGAAPRPIAAADLAKLEAAVAHADRRMRLLYLVLRWTGVRIGEALALRWRDVELAAGRELLTLRNTKGRVDRHVPMTNRALLAELGRTRQVASVDHDRPLFTSSRWSKYGARAWSYRSALVEWDRLCERAGVDATTPHQLRHTRATELGRQLSAFELQRAMGWRKLEHAARYVKVTDADLRAALQRAQRDDERG